MYPGQLCVVRRVHETKCGTEEVGWRPLSAAWGGGGLRGVVFVFSFCFCLYSNLPFLHPFAVCDRQCLRLLSLLLPMIAFRIKRSLSFLKNMKNIYYNTNTFNTHKTNKHNYTTTDKQSLSFLALLRCHVFRSAQHVRGEDAGAMRGWRGTRMRVRGEWLARAGLRTGVWNHTIMGGSRDEGSALCPSAKLCRAAKEGQWVLRTSLHIRTLVFLCSAWF